MEIGTLEGVVVVIGIAVILGVGSTVLGQSATSFDCTRLEGYNPATENVYSGKAKTISKQTNRGGYTVEFSHPAINEGDTAILQFIIRDSDGDIVPGNVGFRFISYFNPDTAPRYQLTNTVFTSGTGTTQIPYTFDDGQGQYQVTLQYTTIDGESRRSSANVNFGINVGGLISAAAPEAFTGWAKTCLDTNGQAQNAWILVPVIMLVIAAVIILAVLRTFN